MSSLRYYTLDEDHVVHGPFDFTDWIEWAKEAEDWETYQRLCIVGRTQVDGDCRVATDFMRGIDLGLGWLDDNVALELFETMVFGGALDRHEERYSTWAQAAAGHERWVRMIMSDHRWEEPLPDEEIKKSPGTRRPGDDAAGAGG